MNENKNNENKNTDELDELLSLVGQIPEKYIEGNIHIDTFDSYKKRNFDNAVCMVVKVSG